ncbi:hypothetical protein [Natrinema versiforme]|uniref:MHYT domain-containing protein n=1 Tax=Natrinema versiforme TaxID=88724 RepID=A0A4P8WN11_9EURY|nr:hypothetical protein [Natrinema versiforme]QCS44745.1 hypothetical protein FEJ81_20945 [Natrinema versiforme]
MSAVSTGLLFGGLWALHFVGVTAADSAVFLERFATPVFLIMVIACVTVLLSELVSGGEFEWIEACAP